MMRISYAADQSLLYIQVAEGPAAETVEIEESIYVDLDADGQPIGMEFLNAADFFDFLERRGGTFTITDANTLSDSVAAD